jgi:hypothetical protein
LELKLGFGTGTQVYIKQYLKGKRRIMEIQIFHHTKIEFSKKIL